MPKIGALLIAAMLAGTTPAAQAADYSDPTWPCIQRKVGELSPGLMWPLPLDPDALPDDEALRDDIAELAETLSLRRVDLEAARPRVEAFAAEHEGDPEILGAVFIRAFDVLSKRRTRVIIGIENFSLGQIGLADRIDANRAEMERLMDAEDPDFDKVDELEEQIDWDQTIYSDRQRSITYLCETPVILEKRLFEIAQLLQGEVASP